MIARTHNLISFASLVTATIYFPPDKLTLVTFILALIANIVGSLLPDIDQASNRLWDLLPGGEGLGKILNNFFGPHRTISHSLLGIYLIHKIVFWAMPNIFNPNMVDSQVVSISFMIGYISHLIADSLTEEGLPLLFPLKIKMGVPPIKPWRIKTGKWFEKYIVFWGTMAYLGWLVFDNWQLLKNIILLSVS